MSPGAGASLALPLPPVAVAAAAGTERLHALQAMRAYAAAMVVFVHGLSTYGSKVDLVSLPNLFSGLGELGVKLFFCISGFIIFNSSRDLVPGARSVIVFLRRRIIRIAPIYWLATLVYAGKLGLQGFFPETEALLLSLLFIPYANEYGLMRPVLGVGWSLNFELFFYLAFAGTLLAGRACRLPLLAVGFAALLAARQGGLVGAGSSGLAGIAYLLADHYLFYFLAGLAVAALRERWLAAGRPGALGGAVVLAATTGLLAIYVAANCLGAIPRDWSEPLLAAVCVACLTLSVAEGGIVTLVGHPRRWLELAGDASYSTYLIHGFVMGPLARLVARFELPVPAIVFALAMVPLCTLVGILCYRWVERPLLKILNARIPQ